MKLAIADPPYLGMCSVYDHDHRSGCWDDLDTHRALFLELGRYDGWAMHLSSPTLSLLLPLAPFETRVGAWVKPFASWKKNVSPWYAWEPVLFIPARPAPEQIRVIDYVSEPITLKRGFIGAKPERVTHWVLTMLGAQPDDDIVDMFPGSGAITRAIEAWRAQLPMFA